MQTKRSNQLFATIAAIVVVLTVIVAKRELRPARVMELSPKQVSTDDAFRLGGILRGDSSARSILVEFVDFECRYCRKMHPLVQTLRVENSGDLAVSYRHFPVSLTGYSWPAAVAAECAAMLGRFDEFSDILFESQDTLRLVSFERVAHGAGIADTVAFKACRNSQRAKERVDADVKAGIRLGVTGTPTFLVGAELLNGEQSLTDLRRRIEASYKRTGR